MVLNGDQPKCWQVHSVDGAASSLCSCEKRWGGGSPIVLVRKNVSRGTSACHSAFIIEGNTHGEAKSIACSKA